MPLEPSSAGVLGAPICFGRTCPALRRPCCATAVGPRRIWLGSSGLSSMPGPGWTCACARPLALPRALEVRHRPASRRPSWPQRWLRAAAGRVPGGSTSGERSRYSMPSPSLRSPRPFMMPLKILVSSSSSSSSSAARANAPAQPITHSHADRGRPARAAQSDDWTLKLVMPITRPPNPLNSRQFAAFEPVSPGIRALLRRCPPTGIHTRGRPPRQRWLHRRG